MPKAKVWKILREKYFNVFITILLLVVFSLLLNKNIWSNSDIRGNLNSVSYKETNWTIEEKGTGIKRVMSDFERLDCGKVYRISTKITYDTSNVEMPYGFLHDSHMFVKVFYDDKEIFSYTQEDVHKWDLARSAGFVYIDFPLPKDCKGKFLTIEFYPTLKGKRSYNVSDIFFGDYKCVIHSMIARDLPHNIVTLLCMLLGVAALIFSVITLKGDDFREGFNIGGFALLVSSYFFTECSSTNYFICSPYYMYLLNYICFSIMPLSFMGVMRECFTGNQKVISTYVVIGETIFLIIELVLHFFGFVDMKEMLPVIHVIAFSEIVLITVFIITMKDKKRRLSLQLQLLPIAIGMVLDAVIYWQHWNIGINDATFSTIGVLIFLFKELISKMIDQNRRITRMMQHTIEGMATLIESRDGSTGEHVRNTGVYAQMIAEEMLRRRMYPKEINMDFVDMIGRIAPLHDVGKIKISDTILNKPGNLTSEEYEIMKTHAAIGGKLIGDILHEDLDPKMLSMAENIATYHHERWDGSGYPLGLKNTQIPLEARIMSVADVFDA